MLVTLTEPQIHDFTKRTLILPTFSAGKTGQLALDLLIYNFDFTKIGYLNIDGLTSVVACLDEKNLSSPTGLSLPAEVYIKDAFVILQLRGNIAQGKSKVFKEQLSKFIADSKFEEVIALSSLSLYDRPDSEIVAGEINVFGYYENFDNKQYHLSHFKSPSKLLLADEKETDIIKKAGMTSTIFKLKGVKPLKKACFFSYSHGLMDLSGATKLCQSVAVALGLTKPGEVTLANPKYWEHIY